MDEPDYAKIIHAIGRTLRDQHASTLEEVPPSQLADLLLHLEQLLRSEAGDPPPENP